MQILTCTDVAVEANPLRNPITILDPPPHRLETLARHPMVALTYNIDCGSDSDAFTDENSIIWMGDNQFKQNGVTQVVQSNKSISHVMDTLRVFTTRNKNCYSIKADKGEKVLVRASFFYGNYDNKSSPPTFDLQFDGNYWDTVETSSDLVTREVIYVVKGETTSVCVAQTKPNEFPFMSALEIRSLDSLMYSHVDSNFALKLKTRAACGANETIRYSDDIYDRIWTPAVVKDGVPINVKSDGSIISINNVEDNPPQAVLQNAITKSATSGPISLIQEVSSGEVPIYLNMYFSELTKLNSAQKRSFRLYKDNRPFSEPIIPPYGNALECKILICRDLSSFGLSGLLPDFSSMDAIETMNLADNQFSGVIPTSLTENNGLNLVVTGNPNLCASGKSCETPDTPISSNKPSTSNSVSEKKKNKLPVILGTTIPSSLVVLAIAGALAMLHQTRKKASVVAFGAGQTGGVKRPNGMASKIGKAVMDKFRMNWSSKMT
ncbi:hypothetical protein RJ639_043186 [Escallonia herrerae]|uniref:Malectin-like domain-containing protein n=1 Tax=Escallonia herrerae TaxID=1293975 RepID=A0AA89B1W4_9ASTE|nr:hypothetical protein RJ639_043186 [Escallonia herrerae]